MSRELAYMTDSLWFNNPSGGHKFHLMKNGMSLCRGYLLNESTCQRWNDLEEDEKCKNCTKRLLFRSVK